MTSQHAPAVMQPSIRSTDSTDRIYDWSEPTVCVLVVPDTTKPGKSCMALHSVDRSIDRSTFCCWPPQMIVYVGDCVITAGGDCIRSCNVLHLSTLPTFVRRSTWSNFRYPTSKRHASISIHRPRSPCNDSPADDQFALLCFSTRLYLSR